MESISDHIFNGRPMPCEHDSLPLSRVGTVQPHGVMMVVGRSGNGSVEHVSANVEKILGITAQDLLGERPTLAFKDLASVAQLDEILQPGRVYFDNPTPLWANGRKFEASCHIRNDKLIIEVEPYVEAEHDYADMVSTALELIAQQNSVAALYAASVRMMEYVTGWDRVMLYKFASHGHGSVVAEQHVANSKLPRSFLNYYFAASDIPENAKELLRSGKARQKPQQDASVPLLTRGPSGDIVASGDAVDMTDAWLRGIHPCDNGYNRNLGVNSNIVFPVNFDNKVWGLFVVHNQTAKFLNYESRVVIEQLTMMFSSRLIELEAAEAHMEDRHRMSKGMLQAISSGVDLMARISKADDEYGCSARLHAVHAVSHHLAALTPTYKLSAGLGTAKLNDPHDRFGIDLMRLADADGVAVLRSGHAPYVHLVGTTPSALSIRGIAAMFGSGLPAFGASDYCVFATDALGDFVPLSEDVRKVACGLLAAPLSACGDFILWFRKEQVIDAVWAGQPPSSAELNSPNMLRARDDFAATPAPLTGAARPWLEAEVYLVCEFAAAVAEIWSRQPAVPNLSRSGGIFEPAAAVAQQSVG